MLNCIWENCYMFRCLNASSSSGSYSVKPKLHDDLLKRRKVWEFLDTIRY